MWSGAAGLQTAAFRSPEQGVRLWVQTDLKVQCPLALIGPTREMWGGVGVCVLKDGFKLVFCFPCPPKNLTAMSKLFQNATPLSAHRNMHYLKLFCMLLLLRRSRARDDHIKCLPTISSFSFYWGGLTPAHWSCSLQTTLLQTAQWLCLYLGNLAFNLCSQYCFPASAEQYRKNEQTAYRSCPSQVSSLPGNKITHQLVPYFWPSVSIWLFCRVVGLAQEEDRARACTQPGHLMQT